MFRHAFLILLLSTSCWAAAPALPVGAKADLIEVDNFGYGYLSGSLPTEPSSSDGYLDAFVAKYRLDTGALVYFARLADPDYHKILSIAVDASGNVYAAGSAAATTHFGSVPIQLLSPAAFGAFVAKIRPDGSIAYATILGKSQYAADIAVNTVGEAYVTGVVLEGELPATPGAAVAQTGVTTTNFVAKLNSAGDKLLLVERGIGGSQIAVDATGNIYVAGTSGGKQNPPITANAFQRTHEDRGCGGGPVVGIPCDYQHVAKLNASGDTLLWSTYLAGTFGAKPAALRIDDQGNVYVAGTTASNDFPVTEGVIGPKYLATRSADVPLFVLPTSTAPTETGFVAKLNSTGSALLFSTYFGGSRSDAIRDLRLRDGQLYLSGMLGSEDLQGANPQMMQECLPGSFVAVMNSDGRAAGRLFVSKGTEGTFAIGPDGLVYTAGFMVHDLTQAPSPVYCALDAASQKIITSVAPGQLISLFGPDMAIGTEAGTPNAEHVLPGNLGWRIANFEGTFAKFLYTSKRQANIVVPYEIAGRTSVTMQYRLFVGFFNELIFSMPFTVVPRSPAAFQLFAPIEYCGFFNSRFNSYLYFYKPTILTLNEDGSLNGCANPARAGSLAAIFVNGGGIAVAAPVSGQIASQATAISIEASMTRGGLLPVPQVTAITLSPGSVNAVWRMQFRIPANAQTGPMPASSLIGGLPVTPDDFFVWTAP
jgi:uncharacterized protein (TIGR03437 family)